MTREQASALGGSRKTPAKLRALQALHASRRGVRVHQAPHDWDTLTAQIRAIAAQRKHGRSLRALAAAVGVTHGSVRNWIAGVDIPSPASIAKIRSWIRKVQ